MTHSNKVMNIRNLSMVSSLTGENIINNVSLSIASGEIRGLVGESGSGKTTLALAMMGVVRPGMYQTSGTAHFNDLDMTTLTSQQRMELFRTKISYVPQSAGFALDPTMRIKKQLIRRAGENKDLAEQKMAQALSDVGLEPAEQILNRFPSQLSGGQQQRVLIAAAFLSQPELIIFDEPTTGLDVTTQATILRMIKDLCEVHQTAAVFVSHDIGAVSEICHEISVMYRGEIVEQGPTQKLLSQPEDSYTKLLLSSILVLGDESDHATADQIEGEVVSSDALRVEQLNVFYQKRQILFDLTFMTNIGKTLGVVGESGSGKSTLLRCIAGLHAPQTGEIYLGDSQLEKNVKSRKNDERRNIQYIFQSPYDSLNPHQTVEQILQTPMAVFRTPVRERKDTIARTLESVGLSPDWVKRKTGSLSGGQRQRLAIARALIVNPQIILCDEITSSLDVSVQESILDLLEEIQLRTNASYVFVTHDMNVIRRLTHEVIVMKSGKIVESGKTDQVLTHPEDPYTKQLIQDTPKLVFNK